MTGLIKGALAGAAAGPIVPFGALDLRPPAEEPDRELLLAARVAELEEAIAQLKDEHRLELEKACEQAASTALAERSDAEEQALERLRSTLGEAHSSWSERLSAWEGAAAGLARAVLERLLAPADQSDLAQLVERSIRRQIGELEASAIVAIRVSASDFDAAALQRSAAGLAPGLQLIADEALDPGGCVIDLKLGHVDLSLDEQWRRIRELLDRAELEGNRR